MNIDLNSVVKDIESTIQVLSGMSAYKYTTEQIACGKAIAYLNMLLDMCASQAQEKKI